MLAFCGISGSIRDHSSSVRSVEYRFVFFSILAIRLGVASVHIRSLDHIMPLETTLFKRALRAKAEWMSY